MTSFEAVSLGKDVIVACAAAVTAFMAVVGINRWRDELKGKAEFEVARTLIRASYKLRDEIAIARSPLVRPAEFPSAYWASKQHSPEEEAQAWAHVYNNRWEPVAEAQRAFEAASLEAEALWGSQIRDRAEALRMCAHDLWVGMETVIDNARSGGENFESNREWAKQVRAVVSASSSATDNALSNRITAAVRAIEDDIRPHLKLA
jgi:hypothetical protein